MRIPPWRPTIILQFLYIYMCVCIYKHNFLFFCPILYLPTDRVSRRCVILLYVRRGRTRLVRSQKISYIDVCVSVYGRSRRRIKKKYDPRTYIKYTFFFFNITYKIIYIYTSRICLLRGLAPSPGRVVCVLISRKLYVYILEKNIM